MPTIRVVHVIESLGLGGAERRLVSDLRWLDRRRYEHRVIYLRPEEALRPEVEALGVPSESLGMRSLRQWPRGVFGLARRLRRWRPHLVHTQVFGADVYGRLAATLAHVPSVVSTVQTLPYDPALTRFYSRKRLAADRLTARLCTDHFVAVSEAVREGLVRAFGVDPGRVRVIGNGVDAERFAPRPDVRQALRRQLGVPLGAFVILHVGRLIPEKDQATLWRAAVLLGGRLPEACVLAAGDGPERAGLESLRQRLGLNRCVRLLGVRSDIEALYQAADVFVLPSLREGMPTALLEAMASGIPVVASDIAPHRELVEQGVTGWLVPPQAPEALAEALAAVARQPEAARRVAAQARGRVVPEWSSQTLAGRLQQMYDELCDRVRTVPGG